MKANECKHPDVYMCHKCSECGRIFDKGFMVDDGGTTVDDGGTTVEEEEQ